MPRGFEYHTMARLLRAVGLLSRKNGASVAEIARELAMPNQRDVTRTLIPALQAWLGPVIQDKDEDAQRDRPPLGDQSPPYRTVCVSRVPNLEPLALKELLTPQEWLLLSFLLNAGGVLGHGKPGTRRAQQSAEKAGGILEDRSLLSFPRSGSGVGGRGQLAIPGLQPRSQSL